jgi:hypothetical protein
MASYSPSGKWNYYVVKQGKKEDVELEILENSGIISGQKAR